VVVAVALLLAGFGSVWSPLTLAVLVSVPGFVALTTMVMVALAPLERLPRLQVTVPSFGEFFVAVERVQVPWVEDTELKCTVAGKASVTVTPVASCGPLLVTLIV
jgi:hypothetical protein